MVEHPLEIRKTRSNGGERFPFDYSIKRTRLTLINSFSKTLDRTVVMLLSFGHSIQLLERSSSIYSING